MKKLSWFLFILLVSTVVSTAALAQKKGGTAPAKPAAPAPNPEEKVIEKAFKDYIAAYNKVTDAGDNTVEPVLAYVSGGFSSALVNYSVTGKITTSTSDLDGFRGYLERVSSTAGLKIAYELKNIERIYVRGDVGVLVYIADYDIQRDGSSWTKGNETVTVTYRKEEGNWKIFHLAVVSIEDEKLKGSCFCELFQSDEDYVAKATVPTGKSYTTSLMNFDFKKSGNDYTFKYENMTFKWLAGGDVFYLQPASNKSKETEVKIGSAATARDAIQIALEKQIFADRCSTMQIKK